jgi:hypothetical protein
MKPLLLSLGLIFFVLFAFFIIIISELEEFSDVSSYEPMLFQGYEFKDPNDPWIQIFSHYAQRANRNYHNEDQKYLICNLDGGLCNRMLHAISCLIYAIHHETVVLYSWWYSPTIYEPISNEWSHIDDYDEIFQRPKNLKPFLLGRSNHTPECAWNRKSENSLYYDLENPTHKSIVLDPFYVIPDSVKCLHFRPHWNYWAATLLFNVRPYSKIPLEANLDTSFAVLARILFQPKYTMSQSYLSPTFSLASPLQCKWLLQHRSRWSYGRGTPSTEHMMDCASFHGLRNEDFNQTFFVSDRDEKFIPSKLMHPSPVQYCRHRPHCDGDTVHMLYLLGTNCERAVLTEMSTFGDCMAGLGPIPKQWKANVYGQCKRKYQLHPDEHAGDYVKI